MLTSGQYSGWQLGEIAVNIFRATFQPDFFTEAVIMVITVGMFFMGNLVVYTTF